MITERLCKGCETGNLELVQTLIERGANPNFVSSSRNKTPLHVAAEFGHPQIIEYLLQNGASVDPMDKFGFTPLILAAIQQGSQERMGVSKASLRLQTEGSSSVRIADMYKRSMFTFIEHNANVTHRDHTGNTLFHVGAALGTLEKLFHFLEITYSGSHHDSLTEPDRRFVKERHQCHLREVLRSPGWGYLSPLHYASDSGHEETVRFLLKNEARCDVNAIDACGWTPLHWAAKNGHYGVCVDLIAAGANVDAQDFRSLTPSALALIFHHMDVFHLLKRTERSIPRINHPKTPPVLADCEEQHAMESPKHESPSPIVQPQLYTPRHQEMSETLEESITSMSNAEDQVCSNAPLLHLNHWSCLAYTFLGTASLVAMADIYLRARLALATGNPAISFVVTTSVVFPAIVLISLMGFRIYRNFQSTENSIGMWGCSRHKSKQRITDDSFDEAESQLTYTSATALAGYVAGRHNVFSNRCGRVAFTCVRFATELLLTLILFLWLHWGFIFHRKVRCLLISRERLLMFSSNHKNEYLDSRADVCSSGTSLSGFSHGVESRQEISSQRNLDSNTWKYEGTSGGMVADFLVRQQALAGIPELEEYGSKEHEEFSVRTSESEQRGSCIVSTQSILHQQLALEPQTAGFNKAAMRSPSNSMLGYCYTTIEDTKEKEKCPPPGLLLPNMKGSATTVIGGGRLGDSRPGSDSWTQRFIRKFNFNRRMPDAASVANPATTEGLTLIENRIFSWFIDMLRHRHFELVCKHWSLRPMNRQQRPEDYVQERTTPSLLSETPHSGAMLPRLAKKRFQPTTVVTPVAAESSDDNTLTITDASEQNDGQSDCKSLTSFTETYEESGVVRWFSDSPSALSSEEESRSYTSGEHDLSESEGEREEDHVKKTEDVPSDLSNEEKSNQIESDWSDDKNFEDDESARSGSDTSCTSVIIDTSSESATSCVGSSRGVVSTGDSTARSSQLSGTVRVEKYTHVSPYWKGYEYSTATTDETASEDCITLENDSTKRHGSAAQPRFVRQAQQSIEQYNRTDPKYDEGIPMENECFLASLCSTIFNCGKLGPEVVQLRPTNTAPFDVFSARHRGESSICITDTESLCSQDTSPTYQLTGKKSLFRHAPSLQAELVENTRKRDFKLATLPRRSPNCGMFEISVTESPRFHKSKKKSWKKKGTIRYLWDLANSFMDPEVLLQIETAMSRTQQLHQTYSSLDTLNFQAAFEKLKQQQRGETTEQWNKKKFLLVKNEGQPLMASQYAHIGLHADRQNLIEAAQLLWKREFHRLTSYMDRIFSKESPDDWPIFYAVDLGHTDRLISTPNAWEDTLPGTTPPSPPLQERLAPNLLLLSEQTSCENTTDGSEVSKDVRIDVQEQLLNEEPTRQLSPKSILKKQQLSNSLLSNGGNIKYSQSIAFASDSERGDHALPSSCKVPLKFITANNVQSCRLAWAINIFTCITLNVIFGSFIYIAGTLAIRWIDTGSVALSFRFESYDDLINALVLPRHVATAQVLWSISVAISLAYTVLAALGGFLCFLAST